MAEDQKDAAGKDKQGGPDKDAPAAPKGGTDDQKQASKGQKRGKKAGFSVYHPGLVDEAWVCAKCTHSHGAGQFLVCQACGNEFNPNA